MSLKSYGLDSTYTEYWLTKDEVDKVSSKSFVESCMLPPELNPNLTVATPIIAIQVEKIVMYEVYIAHRLIH